MSDLDQKAGTAVLVRQDETRSIFTGAPITRREYHLDPPLDGHQHIVLSTVTDDQIEGGQDTVVLPADKSEWVTILTDAVNPFIPDPDVEESLRPQDYTATLTYLGYEVANTEENAA
jgi:hypothetical protein